MSAAAERVEPLASAEVMRWGSLRNGLVLIAVLIAIWQLLYLWIGESALASPAATLPHCAPAREAFWNSTMTILVRTELIGTKLHRVLIFNDGKYIGEYERSQEADILRKQAEIFDA